jgi:glycogen debranching enzyme
LSDIRRTLPARVNERAARMEALVSGNLALDAGDPDRTKALLWMRLTADQLVMKQMGTGIYAGLPWFNDYWGRDTFISITGTLFVTGQYEVAADVFRSFAALQDVREGSKTYGRVPNRARPDGIEYNSADGTPRFIITLADLVFRTGDETLAHQLWPVVKRAVDGVLANNVDETGLITHDDADTWMDAKEKGVRAWSPRGNRAIDVQTLWLHAFRYAADLYGLVSERPSNVVYLPNEGVWSNKLHNAKDKLKSALQTFENPTTGQLVDHIRPDGKLDESLRPNVLFSIGHKDPVQTGDLQQLERDMRHVRVLWESLVYPWGVATLNQEDPNFYPYHEHWHYYHKDAAYHNGTVWPWLNGIAIQRLIEFNQIAPAWQLFENMNRQALKEGAVGSLAECADALPIEGASWARRTGTFLQAWSNAEHLRVWNECFLGCTVTGPYSATIRPRLPTSVLNVATKFKIGSGFLDANFHNHRQWRFKWYGDNEITIEFEPLTETGAFERVILQPNWVASFDLVRNSLRSRVIDATGKSVRTGFSSGVPVETSQVTSTVRHRTLSRAQIRALERRIFAGLDFCKPKLNPNLKSLSVRYDPPLTY